MRKQYLAAALVAVLVIAGAAFALTSGDTIAGGGDDDEPLTGSALERASAAALEHTGEGRVTETEVGDGGSAYEVEVLLDDGSQVEVQIDADFNVVGDEADDDGAEGDDADGDDD
ncbi:MAG: PepSY domain-containing protein [Dehalococcoidia bacterium]